MHSIPILSAEDIEHLITRRAAAHAVRDALLAGLDPGADPARSVLDLRSGQLLLMPSERPSAVGVKAVTVAPGNVARGLPRVHGAYLLYDAATLELRMIMDGAALSSLRTPAVAMAAVEPAFTRFGGPVRVTVFGAGPQAIGHVEALATGGFARVRDVACVVRSPERVAADLPGETTVLAASDPAVAGRLRESEVIITATTASTPLFDSRLVRDDAVVVVIGAHEAVNREVDGSLMARSSVVVEDRQTALREGGDVVLAVAEGLLAPGALLEMADVVRGTVPLDPGRPCVFKSVGMSWEDLVVAEAIRERHAARLAGEPSQR